QPRRGYTTHGVHSSLFGVAAMSLTVEAVYENGVLKPVQPLPLQEHERIRVTIEPRPNWVQETAGILKWAGSPEDLQRVAADSELDFPPPPEGSCPSRTCRRAT